jgi:hypothetical protein
MASAIQSHHVSLVHFYSPLQELSQIPEFLHNPLYAGILRKGLILMDNLPSSGIRGILRGGVK